MRFGVTWGFLWIRTASSRPSMIHLLSGMLPMRLLLLLLMLHFLVPVAKPVLLVAVFLLPLAVLLQVAKRSVRIAGVSDPRGGGGE